MKTIGVGIILSLCLAQVADAGNLYLVSRGITWTENDGDISGQLILGINNTGASNGLLGWQIRCEIHPIAGASGLFFDCSDEFPYAAFNEPPNYVFEGIFGHYILPGDDSSEVSLTATDLIFGDPIDVPAEDANLLQINFSLSPDAFGNFDIVIIANGDEDSGWFYEDTEPFTLLPFDLPPSGIIESLSIPEPSTTILLITALLVCVFERNRSQRTVPIFAVHRENGTVPLGGERDRHIFHP